MTDVPKLTDDEATVLRSMWLSPDRLICAHDNVTSRGLHCTSPGKELLAAYDAEQRRKIRVAAMRECEEVAMEAFDNFEDDRAFGARDVGEAIRALIAKERP